MIDFDKARARAADMTLEEETEILKKALDLNHIDYYQDEEGRIIAPAQDMKENYPKKDLNYT